MQYSQLICIATYVATSMAPYIIILFNLIPTKKGKTTGNDKIYRLQDDYWRPYKNCTGNFRRGKISVILSIQHKL